MKLLMIARSTLFTSPGGDTTQIEMTAKYLRVVGVFVDIKLSHENMDYENYDLLHFFNIIRPDDIWPHLEKTKVPFVISTIFVDYFEYEKKNRKGLISLVNSIFDRDQIEYIKTIALTRGQRKSIQASAEKAAILLPNSHSEYNRFVSLDGVKQRYQKVVNAIDPSYFSLDVMPNPTYKDHVLCVGRIEGRKNQLNLIKALINSEVQLTIIGKPSPNHIGYYEQCQAMAKTGQNVHFIQHVDHKELAALYKAAKVHVLPSWFETTGLSSLEAGAMGCNVVVTRKGDTEEYFNNMAYYCEPDDVESIRKAVFQAHTDPVNPTLQDYIFSHYTWRETAEQTLQAYQLVLKQ